MTGKKESGYLEFLAEVFTDKPTMDFESYIKLAQAMHENPGFNPILAIAYYLDVMHNLIERNPIMFDEIAECVNTDVWAMMKKCPDCGKPLFHVVDGGKKDA